MRPKQNAAIPLEAEDPLPEQMLPEVSVFTSVLTQAVSDVKLNEGKGRVAQEAWHFLTDAAGGWAQSRKDICELVGVCPDKLRRNILDTLEDPQVRRAREAKERRRKARMAA